MIRFVVKGRPVSANKLYAPRRGGGLMKTAAYRTYRQLIAFHARKAMLETFGRGKGPGMHVARFGGFCTVKLTFYFDSARPDGDNAVKPTLDALADGGIVEDDRQFVNYVVQKRIDRKNPRIEIEVWDAGLLTIEGNEE